jgi:hypothetical protein
MSSNKDESIKELIDKQVRSMINDLDDVAPREKESLAGAIEKLLRAKLVVTDSNLDLFELLNRSAKGPSPS